MTSTSTPALKSRAGDVLERVLASGEITIDDVAEALMVRVPMVEAYRAGRVAMPLEHQLLLAAYAIERAPNYGRLGHRLRGQIRAAIAFAARHTTTRSAPRIAGGWLMPPDWE